MKGGSDLKDITYLILNKVVGLRKNLGQLFLKNVLNWALLFLLDLSYSAITLPHLGRFFLPLPKRDKCTSQSLFIAKTSIIFVLFLT